MTSEVSAGRIEYPADLPISAHVDDIARLINEHPVVVVAGETGSGKTTQLPKVLLAAGRRRIAHTQPRRIAARTVAERIAAEMGTELGDQVGYQVRFTTRASDETRLKVVTDGVLLAEIGHDRDLRRYDAIIIDEAHERSLNIDFLLGYLKQLLRRRNDLKVIITSATIDTKRFSEHFDNAPIVEVSGRTYPVEIRYRPLETEDADVDQTEGIARAVAELTSEGPGDILVFLSGEREIRDAADALEALRLPNTEIRPLFARLSADEQHAIFAPHTTRRIVLATNVAETSITVPGIRYVIDAGTARISRYSARTKVQRLPIEEVSQASANQRAGRCGRLDPGVCIRLYSEENFQARPEFTEPEILRTNLASVILQMAQARLGSMIDFPFVEAPDRRNIADGMRLLEELGALKPSKGPDAVPRLTGIGRQLARIPLDPRLGRMLVEANRQGCVNEVRTIVAALAIPDVKERPDDHREQADAMHRRFWSDEGLAQALEQRSPSPGRVSSHQSSSRPTGEPLRFTAHTGWKGFRSKGRSDAGPGPVDAGGDIIALLRLFAYLSEQRRRMSGSQFRRMCRDEYLHYLRIREWQDMRTQLDDISRDLGFRANRSPAPQDAILKSVLAGLLSQVGLLEVTEKRGKRPGTREYLGGRGARFAIQPGSALAKRPPELVMAVELVETSRLWARNVAAIEPEWIEDVGSHALKRSHSDPYWSSSAGAVMVHERVTLFGVPIIVNRPVPFAGIDPVRAREEFIRAALVEGQWRSNYPFVDHNAAIRAEAEALEERTRTRGIVADDRVVFDFYDRRIPQEVVSQSHFDAWWRRVADPHVVDMTLDDLINPDADVDVDAFPERWSTGDVALPVSYVFDPGDEADGVTVTVALEQVNQLDAAAFSWQVPGLRHELATELIRALPKRVRTNFVPAPDWASKALDWLSDHDEDRSRPLWLELGRALTALTGVVVADDEWRPADVPDHLQVRFAVTEHGAVKNVGKDLAGLQEGLSERVSRTLTRAARDRAVTGATEWNFGSIERTVEIRRGSLNVVGYPGMTDEGASVGVRVFDTAAAAAVSHALGLRRLLTLTNPDQTKWVVAHLTNADKLALGASPYPGVPELLADARLKTAERLLNAQISPVDVRDAETYERVALAVRQDQADTMRSVVATAAESMRRADETRRAVAALPASVPARGEIADQLDNLIFAGFIQAIPDPWFDHVPRYLRALTARAEQAKVDPARDERLVEPLLDLEDAYADLLDAQPPGPLAPDVDEIGYLIEELRVQTFAQQLRTSVSVSPKRIRKAIEKAAGPSR